MGICGMYVLCSVVMCIDVVPNRNSKPAILLREFYREKGNVHCYTHLSTDTWTA